jgi:hypothetical protein
MNCGGCRLCAALCQSAGKRVTVEAAIEKIMVVEIKMCIEQGPASHAGIDRAENEVFPLSAPTFFVERIANKPFDQHTEFEVYRVPIDD